MKLFKFQWKGWRRFIYDFFVIQIGFLLFGLSIDVIVNASLGLDSWDVLQMALTYHMPITLGESSIGVASLIVLMDIILKEPLGWGTEVAGGVYYAELCRAQEQQRQR